MSAPTVDEVVACIERRRYGYATEDELQRGLLEAIATDGWPVAREVRLDRYSRLDLLVGDPRDGPGIAVEVKVAGGRADLLRQVRRYVGYQEVAGVVLVTGRVRHGAVPRVVLGKPLRVVQLALQGL